MEDSDDDNEESVMQAAPEPSLELLKLSHTRGAGVQSRSSSCFSWVGGVGW